ncbi:MAG: adenylate/guanylate cyclase domain-containing protein, partial [Deltaproteobacteria bacterium]|nr:adenylate/guanylate cyclase domain-containing protein [Deltaproteobacteria bacterium]
MTTREAVPRWLVVGALIALAANFLAAGMTNVTIGLMRSRTAFADAVRAYDLSLIPFYNALAYPFAIAAIAAYVWPIVRHFRCDAAAAAADLLVQRRTVNAPLVVAAIGLLPWLLSALLFPLMTLHHFGHWAPELASQQIVSPIVNGFLAATTTYLLLDWLFRVWVVPRVFPRGGAGRVPGSLALGVRARLLVFVLAVAFTPLFTVLGLIRAASARVAGGDNLASVLAELQHASQVTFFVYLGLGVAFTLLLARTLTRPLGDAAQALRRIEGGDLATRVAPASSDEVGVLADGVNAMAAALQDRQRILSTFGRIVEPAVRDHLLAGELRLGGELRFATALFCDLRGFTALSERLGPTETVALLNQFVAAMAGWARAEGGFVDMFLGDAMLVVFGLFGHLDDAARARAAAAALRCARGLPARLSALNAART